MGSMRDGVLDHGVKARWGLPASRQASQVAPVQELGETQVQSLGGEDPLEKEMTTSRISCLENSMHKEPGGLQSM